MIISRRKIILMSRLAAYEKNYGKKDKKNAQYYQNDYVYLKNTRTRIAAGIGAIIVIAFIWTHRIIVGGIDILAIDYQQELIRTGIAIAAVLAVYTLIGTVKESAEYAKSAKRLNKYLNWLNQLDQITTLMQETLSNREAEPLGMRREAARLNGANAVHPRRNS